MNGAVNVFKFQGTTALFVFFTVVALFGTLHLVALAHPESKFGKAWIILGF